MPPDHREPADMDDRLMVTFFSWAGRAWTRGRRSRRPVWHGHKVLGVPEVDVDDGEGRAAVELAE